MMRAQNEVLERLCQENRDLPSPGVDPGLHLERDTERLAGRSNIAGEPLCCPGRDDCSAQHPGVPLDPCQAAEEGRLVGFLRDLRDQAIVAPQTTCGGFAHDVFAVAVGGCGSDAVGSACDRQAGLAIRGVHDQHGCL